MKKIYLIMSVLIMCIFIGNITVYAKKAKLEPPKEDKDIPIGSQDAGSNILTPTPTPPSKGGNTGGKGSTGGGGSVTPAPPPTSDAGEDGLPPGVLYASKTDWRISYTNVVVDTKSISNELWFKPNGNYNWYVKWYDKNDELKKMTNEQRTLMNHNGEWFFYNETWDMEFIYYAEGQYDAKQVAVGRWYYKEHQTYHLEGQEAREITYRYKATKDTPEYSETVTETRGYTSGTRTRNIEVEKDKYRVYSGSKFEENPAIYKDWEWYAEVETGCDFHDNWRAECREDDGLPKSIPDIVKEHPVYDDDAVEYWLERVY